MSVKPITSAARAFAPSNGADLLIITIATIIAGFQEIMRMFAVGEVTLETCYCCSSISKS